MGSRHYYDDFHYKHPFAIVFRYSGTVWPLVLPYCLINLSLLAGLAALKHYTDISLHILPQGHALMSLLIAYLGVSKVNLAYERYMSAQIATGHAFIILRELHQLSITLTEQYRGVEADEWRNDTKRTIVQLIHETVATLRNERHAAALARNVGYRSGIGIDSGGSMSRSSPGATVGATTVVGATVDTVGLDDPMVLVHALRSHLFHNSHAICRNDDTHRGVSNNGRERDDNVYGDLHGDTCTGLRLFERFKLVDLLGEFQSSYRNLLRLASSPLPFVLVQMGRTFIFIWTLTIPLVLTGDNYVVEEFSAIFFVVLLTYGFLGLEFVSRMLSNPFGGEIDNDFNITGMGSAAIVGIEEDSRLMFHRDRRVGGNRYENDRAAAVAPFPSLSRFVQKRQESIRMSTRYIVLDASKDVMDCEMVNTPYYNMDGDEEDEIPSAFL